MRRAALERMDAEDENVRYLLGRISVHCSSDLLYSVLQKCKRYQNANEGALEYDNEAI